MRVLTFVLLGLVAAIQYPLWLGKGGWLRVWDMDRQVEASKAKNDVLQARNAGLEAEVADLKQGYGAIEERARFDLGMVKSDEVFFQVVPQAKPPAR
jgi:cell division protein FtsB